MAKLKAIRPAGGNSIVTSSKNKTLQDVSLMIQGPVDVGKTFLAATASSKWPETLPSATWVDIDDMIWLQVDRCATAGFGEQKINIPHLIDIVDAIRSFGFDTALRMVFQEIENLQEKFPQIAWVVLDTASRFDLVLRDHYSKNFTKYDLWNAVLNMHVRFNTNLLMTGLKRIILTHSRVAPDTEAEKTKQKASQVTTSKIVPSLSGQARDMYLGDASMLAVLLAKRNPKTKELTRTLYPCGTSEFEGKNKWRLTLDIEEPPHLGKLFAKIEAQQSE